MGPVLRVSRRGYMTGVHLHARLGIADSQETQGVNSFVTKAFDKSGYGNGPSVCLTPHASDGSILPSRQSLQESLRWVSWPPRPRCRSEAHGKGIWPLQEALGFRMLLVRPLTISGHDRFAHSICPVEEPVQS